MKTSLSTALLAIALSAPAAPDPAPGPAAPPSHEQAVAEWRSLKFGLFIHFGLYSIPGGVWNGVEVRRGYSEQIQSHGRIPRKDYARLTQQFNPEKWDPDAVALLAKEAGMRYIVLTAKHHDGFNLFDTEFSGYDVIDATPCRKDLVKGLADACARHGLKFGVYFSIIDWNFPYSPPISDHNSDPVPPELQALITGQLEELTTRYGPLCEIWFDMGAPTAEQSRIFADTVHRFQPATLVSGRVWNDAGDFLVMGDNQVPDDTYFLPWKPPPPSTTPPGATAPGRCATTCPARSARRSAASSASPPAATTCSTLARGRRLRRRVRGRRAQGRRRVDQAQRRGRLRRRSRRQRRPPGLGRDHPGRQQALPARLRPPAVRRARAAASRQPRHCRLRAGRSR
ncbi:MAG: alpha-L-fucosidase [Kiritimatiellia bacterium]